MRTIAVIARKGGSGKTTIATHLALGAWLRGRRTLLADTDPQRSSAQVLEARRGKGPERAECTGPRLCAVQMAAMRNRFEALIVDTPAGAEEELSCALVLSDLALLVLRPTWLDMAAVVRTVDIVRRLKKPVLVALNQAPAAREGVEPPSVVRALKALKLLRLSAAPQVIRARQVYQTALESGRSVEELTLDRAAAREMGEFMNFIDGFALSRRSGAA
ncbi:MAG TPA: ParA family protein [Caulobacteraceae bacterium]|nr:ParA family protein [Caulobacteraceae bacterium]